MEQRTEARVVEIVGRSRDVADDIGVDFFCIDKKFSKKKNNVIELIATDLLKSPLI